MNILGNRIKKERENLGLSREELAQKLGVSYSAIAMYEQGNREPNHELILKMCEIFDCSVDYIMGISNIKSFKSTISNTLNDLGVQIEKYIPEFKLIRNFNLSEKEINFLLNKLLYYLQPNTVINEDDYKKIDISNYTKSIKSCLFIILRTAEILKEEKEAYNIIQPKLKNLINYNMTSYYLCPVIGKIAAGKPILAQENIEDYLPVDPSIYGMSTTDDLFFLKVSGNSMNQKVKNGDYALIHKQNYAENGDIVVAIVNGDDEATLKRYKEINKDLIALEPMSDDPSYETIYIDKNTNFQIVGKAIGQFGKF